MKESGKLTHEGCDAWVLKKRVSGKGEGLGSSLHSMSRKVTIGPSLILQGPSAFLNFAGENELASFLLKGAGSECLLDVGIS
jgi:hypothetical protein